MEKYYLQERLVFMSFLQFFVWGAWLITIGVYCGDTMGWSVQEFGAIFSTMGISSLFMPTITGLIADRWINAEKLYALFHLLGGLCLLYIPHVTNPTSFFWVIFVAMLFYMPTISLSNSIAYNILKSHNYDLIKAFPPIRVFGTIGFIAAMWTTNLTGNKATDGQFYIAAIAAFVLALYALTMPACKPHHKEESTSSQTGKILHDAFRLFRDYKMAVFFIFSMLLGAALQLTNMYGDRFVSDFGSLTAYKDSLVVRYSTLIMSISQISETLFILTIPFFLKRFGIKNVMLISMLAWVFRFGLLAFANPADRLWMIVLSGIVYGMAFDFFNVSGSLFVESATSPRIRSSAQGVFMMMTNGIGAIMGSYLSGLLIDSFFTSPDGKLYWTEIWLSFSGYSLVVAVLFAMLFKHKHTAETIQEITH